jgi:hypothetical protein
MIAAEMFIARFGSKSTIPGVDCRMLRRKNGEKSQMLLYM